MILVIGDSLSLPRNELDYSKTWPFLLNSLNLNSYDFHLGSNWGATSKILKITSLLTNWKPDYIFIQLGIVDCAPRLINNIEQYILSKLPNYLVKTYIKLIKKIRFRNRNRVRVNKLNFYKNFANFIFKAQENNVKKIFIIEIAPAGINMQQKSKEIIFNIEEYNKILYKLEDSKLTKIIKYSDFFKKNVEQFLLDDGHHLNEKGHKELYKILIEQISFDKTFHK